MKTREDVQLAPTPRSRHFITDDELSTWTPAPELVKGLLSSGEVNMLFAPKNRGKTFLGLHLAYSIATRQSHFLGCRINRYGTVVYLCAEGRGGLPRRRAAWRQVRRYEQPAPKIVFWRDLLDLRNGGHVDTLIEQVREHYSDVALVVIDTLSQHMPASDEGTSDMSAALHSCQRIRDDLGTTVLGIHHPSKADEDNERGGSGFRGGCADVLNVKARDGVFWLTTQNARDRSADTDPIPYVLDVVALDGYRDDEGGPLTSCVVRHLDAPNDLHHERGKIHSLDQLVLDALTKQPAAAAPLSRTIKRRKADVQASLERHSAAGRVTRDMGSRRWVVVQ